MGKEWTSATGELLTYDPMWVKIISTHGEVEHTNWREKYMSIRQAVGVYFPGMSYLSFQQIDLELKTL